MRPGAGLLEAGDHIICAYLDRGFRCLKDYACLMPIWEAHGITVHFADIGVDLSTATGKLVGNILASVAQGQSDMLSEKNKAVAAELRRQNRPTNKNAPCGWRIAGPKGRRYLVPDERDRRVMAEIARLHDEEGLGFVRISEIIRRRAKAAYSTAREYSTDGKGYWWSWCPQKCWHQYNNWKKMLAQEAAKPPENGNREGDLFGA